MEMVLFIGIQAAGKSAFYLEKFYRTHVRINGDMLKTRHREELLIQACFEGKTPFVVDKMNLTRADRAAYISLAKAAGFRISGYFFESDLAAALQRNARRDSPERIPEGGVRAASKALQSPSSSEGFDQVFAVRMDGRGGFHVEELDMRDDKNALDIKQSASAAQFNRQSDRYGKSHILADTQDVEQGLRGVLPPSGGTALKLQSRASRTKPDT